LYRGSSKFFLKEIFFGCDEDVLVTPLTEVQREFPTVQVGSYPDYSDTSSYSVRVALESRDVELIEKVKGS
jgi:molybdopterin-biosynthesis enzyme MoeA-like protein